MKKEPELRYDLPKVKDVMTSPAIALTEKHSVYDALSVFNKYKVSAIPVVKEQSNRLTGIVSEGDCLKQLAQTLFFDEITDDSIGQIIIRDVKTIKWEMDIFELEDYFQKQGIRHAPVVDEGNRVIGTVSRQDILGHLEKFIKKVMRHRKEVKDPLKLSMYKDFENRIEGINDKHSFKSLT